MVPSWNISSYDGRVTQTTAAWFGGISSAESTLMMISSFSASLSPSLDLGDCEGALCRNVFFPAFVYMWLKTLRLHLIPLVPIVCITPGFVICSHTQISFNPKSMINVCTCNSPGKQSCCFFLDLPRNSISNF